MGFIKKLILTVYATVIWAILSLVGVITSTIAWPVNVFESILVNLISFRTVLVVIWYEGGSEKWK